MGKPETLIKYVKDRPGHDRRYSMDISKIEALGFQPDTNFEGLLEETVRWYVDNPRVVAEDQGEAGRVQVVYREVVRGAKVALLKSGS